MLAFLLAPLDGCKGKDQSQKTVEEADLLVCTFNIRYGSAVEEDSKNNWDNRKAGVLKFIQTRKPDIIGLQEVEKAQANYLNDNLKSEYGFYGIGRESGANILTTSKTTESSCAIMYRKDRFTLSKEGRFWHTDINACENVVQKSGSYYGTFQSSHPLITVWGKLADKTHASRPVWFFATHYQNNKNMTSTAPGIRQQESNLHINKMQQLIGEGLGPACQNPVILLGDFNTTFDKDELQLLKNAPMGYARSDAVKSGSRDRSTNNDWGKGSGIIDHIFYCGPLKSLEYRVDSNTYENVTYISDHYPVLASFKYTDQ